LFPAQVVFAKKLTRLSPAVKSEKDGETAARTSVAVKFAQLYIPK
jgi:hypothetical protein